MQKTPLNSAAVKGAARGPVFMSKWRAWGLLASDLSFHSHLHQKIAVITGSVAFDYEETTAAKCKYNAATCLRFPEARRLPRQRTVNDGIDRQAPFQPALGGLGSLKHVALACECRVTQTQVNIFTQIPSL